MKKIIKAKTEPYPYLIYYLPVVFFVLSGLINSVYLAASHYKNFTDIDHISFCAISKAINCDTVSQSPFSVFCGLPVPLWGILGYSLLLILVIFAGNAESQKKRGWALIFMLSLSFSLYSLVLAFVSGYYIKSYCILCILSYAINLLVLFFSWIIQRRFGEVLFWEALKNDVCFLGSKRFIRCFLVTILIILVGLWLFLPKYWKMALPPLSGSGIDSGMTEDEHPWIGSKNPKLTIMEFSDYECFQCRKVHFFLRKLVEAHPDKIRLIHFQYPMDNEYNKIVVQEPFHVGSGKLSLIAIYAAAKGTFWDVNDILFEIGSKREDINIKIISEKTKLTVDDIRIALNHESVLSRLNRDIFIGMKFLITATPAFVIEDKVYIGELPLDIIQHAVND